MFGLKLIRTQEYERLLADIEFWRESFQGERQRNDRLTDSVVQSAGHPPVSDEGLAQMKKLRATAEKEVEAMSELQDDELELLPSILGDLLEEEGGNDKEKAN